MSAELHADETARPRPNVSGDLPTIFSAAPMFNRAVAGYDRFQVDTYVRWAEDELATAEREHQHLQARYLRTRAALDEAGELLSHSSGGGELLRLSRRIGSLLAAAADQAEGMRAEAAAERSAAAARAERILTRAERVLGDAEAEGRRVLARAATQAEEAAARAALVLRRAEEEARRTDAAARAEAAARLAEVRSGERRAAADAERIRRRAAEDAASSRVHARDEAVRVLGTAREQRHRADAEAAAARERLDRTAVARAAALRAEVAALEDRRSALLAEVDPRAGRLAPPDGVPVRRPRERRGWRSGVLRTR